MGLDQKLNNNNKNRFKCEIPFHIFIRMKGRMPSGKEGLHRAQRTACRWWWSLPQALPRRDIGQLRTLSHLFECLYVWKGTFVYLYLYIHMFVCIPPPSLATTKVGPTRVSKKGQSGPPKSLQNLWSDHQKTISEEQKMRFLWSDGGSDPKVRPVRPGLVFKQGRLIDRWGI